MDIKTQAAVAIAQTDWHSWYESDDWTETDADHHRPRANRVYQGDECNLEYYSRLTDDDVHVLMVSLEGGARLEAWRLGHFYDLYVQHLATVLNRWLLIEPCFESARLPWQAHLQLIHFGNPGVSRCLLEHMLRQGVSRGDILEALASDDDIQGEENIEPVFAGLLRDCEKTVLQERLIAPGGKRPSREESENLNFSKWGATWVRAPGEALASLMPACSTCQVKTQVTLGVGGLAVPFHRSTSFSLSRSAAAAHPCVLPAVFEP